MMSRKQFFHSLVGISLGAFGVATLAGCSSGGGGDGGGTGDNGEDPIPPDAPAPAPAPKSCTTNGTSVTIGTNHNHVMTISKDDVTEGKQKTYEIQGTSAHPHKVIVTAAMFTMLKSGTNVTATSSTDGGHAHQITISCA